MKCTFLSILLVITLAACSEPNNPKDAVSSHASFPALPINPSETVIVSGKMVFWMYEGDGGCFGSISDGAQELQLWVDVTTCGEAEYKENESASVEITFNPKNQYGPGKTYTIVSFR